MNARVASLKGNGHKYKTSRPSMGARTQTGISDKELNKKLEQVLERLMAPAADLEALRRKKLLTGDEVHRLYNLNNGTLRNLRSQGRGPKYIKDGAKVLYRHNDIEEYIHARTCRTED